MPDLDRIDLGMIATALEDQNDYDHRWLINPETGEIVFWTRDTGIDGRNPVDLDELDLLCSDPVPSYEWYEDMADFAERISEEYPQLLPVRHAFRNARATRRAVEWLVDHSLIDEADARRLPDRPTPTPTCPDSLGTYS